MAFPVVTFNAGSGSDTLASGAGPATAVTGSSATTSGASTTISLDGSPDLSGVVADEHVIWITNHGFYRITAVDDGANTVTVETAVNISTGRAWAIGGKRATLAETESRRLLGTTAAGVGADSGTSGAQGQWEIVLEDNQTLSGSTFNIAITAGTGNLIIRSDGTTVRSITQPGSLTTVFTTTSTHYIEWRYIQFLHSNATKANRRAGMYFSSDARHVYRNCLFGAVDGTNAPQYALQRSSGTVTVYLYNCAIFSTYRDGVTGTMGFGAYGCLFSKCGVDGTSGSGIAAGMSPTLIDCIITRCYANGVGVMSTMGYFERCVFDSNTGDGIGCSTNNIRQAGVIRNCIFSNNGGYGVNCSGTTPNFPLEHHNLYYNNNGGGAGLDVVGFTVDSTSITGTDPNFVDETDGVWNYATTGAAVKALGFPSSAQTVGAGQSGTTNYVDIGVQQQASGGTIIIEDSMQIIPLNNTTVPLVFAMRDSAGAYVTGLSPTVTLSKNGGAFASPSGAVAEIGSTGKYTVAANATDANTAGSLVLNATGAGAIPVSKEFHVASAATVPSDEDNAAAVLAAVPSLPVAVPVLGTANLGQLMAWVGLRAVHKFTQTSTEAAIRNAADNANLFTAPASDDNTTFLIGPWSTP